MGQHLRRGSDALGTLGALLSIGAVAVLASGESGAVVTVACAALFAAGVRLSQRAHARTAHR